jgi:hypothetical protein
MVHAREIADYFPPIIPVTDRVCNRGNGGFQQLQFLVRHKLAILTGGESIRRPSQLTPTNSLFGKKLEV